jgi:hypothetical protein
MMKARGVFYYGRFIVLGIAFLALFTYVVMLLWNWLVPELFSGPVLSYWQTLGILVLSKILFTGLGRNHRNGTYWKYRTWGHGHTREYWKKRFEEKLNEKHSRHEPGFEPDQENGGR